MTAAVAVPMFRERPILFKGEMVRAILDGRKTQTRRLLKASAETLGILDSYGPGWDVGSGGAYRMIAGGTFSVPFRGPYGFCGDRLWVKEDHAIRRDVDPKSDLDKARHYLRYRADRGDGDDLGMEWHDYGRGWRPSIHMPRWASRLTLEISEVRVQRLQEISEDDARTDGVRVPDAATARQDTVDTHEMTPYRAAFACKWDEINGKRKRDVWDDGAEEWRTVVDTSGRWEANPWVWAISFRRVS